MVVVPDEAGVESLLVREGQGPGGEEICHGGGARGPLAIDNRHDLPDGLLAGLGTASRTQILGVDVGTRPDLDDRVPQLARDAAAFLGRGAPNASVMIDHDHIGGGYGALSDACLEALRVFAQVEGLLLDPVYSGKAAAAMFTAVRDRRIGVNDTVVFWATGGSPALFTRRYEHALRSL